jgi:hypothetical protein
VDGQRKLAPGLIAVAMVAGGFAILAVLGAEGGDHGVASTPTAGDNGLPPRPTIVSRRLPTMPEGLADLDITAPTVTDAVREVEDEDAAALASRLRRWRGPCDQIMERGVTRCEALGLPPGSPLELATLEGSYYGPADIAARAMEHFVAGRTPRAALIAHRSDGAILVEFDVVAAGSFSFPGGDTTGSLTQTHLEVVFDRATGDVLSIGDYSDGRPPLETMRVDEHRGVLTYRVTGVADSYVARVAARDDSVPRWLEAHSRP